MDSNAQGGLGMIVQDRPQIWSKESTHFHGLNVVRCKVVASKRTPLIVAYPPYYSLDHLLELSEALTRFRYQAPIVAGDLNSDIQAQKPCSQQVAEPLMEFELVGLRHHLSIAGGSVACNVFSYAA